MKDSLLSSSAAPSDLKINAAKASRVSSNRRSFIRKLLVTVVSLGLINLSISASYASYVVIEGGTKYSPGPEAWNTTPVTAGQGAVVINGDDDYCGADLVQGRPDIWNTDKTQSLELANDRTTGAVSLEEEYERFMDPEKGKAVHNNGGNPYGRTETVVAWDSGKHQMQPSSRPAAATNARRYATGVHSLSYGCGVTNTGNYGMSLGVGSTVRDGGGVAFGAYSYSEGPMAMALGMGATATGLSNLAVGSLAISRGENSIAVGTRSEVQGKKSLAIGSDAKASGDSVTVIGHGAMAEQAGDVALGSASVTDKVVNTASAEILKGKPVQFAGSNAASTVSIGAKGQERTLTNLAAGRISKDSTDGVNGSQLYGVVTSLQEVDKKITDQINLDTANLDKILKLFSPDSKFEGTTATLSLKVGEDAATSVQDAIDKILQFTSVEIADALDQSGGGQKITAGENIDIATADNALVINTKKDVKFTTVSLGDTGPVLSATGIDMKTQKISGLAKGVIGAESQDAINGSQLFDFGNLVAQLFGADSTFDGSKFDLGLNVAGKDVTTVQDAINSVLAYTEVAIAEATNKEQKITAGENIDIATAGDDLVINTKKDVKFTTVSLGDTGPVLSATGIDMKTQKISDLGNGVISAESKDAINGSQLFDFGNVVAKLFGGNSTFDGSKFNLGLKVAGKDVTTVQDAIDHMLDYTEVAIAEATNKDAEGHKIVAGENIELTATGGDLVINTKKDVKFTTVSLGDTGPVLSATGIDMKTQKISGLANGAISADSRDAINGSQLFDFGDVVAKLFGGDSTFDGSKFNLGLKVAGVNVNSIQEAIDKLVDNTAEQIAAGSKDAISGGQLQAVGDDVATALGGGASFKEGKLNQPTYNVNGKDYHDVGAAIKALNDWIASGAGGGSGLTDEVKKYVNSKVDGLSTEVSKAGAVGLAASALKFDLNPGKFSMAVGTSYWKGAAAFSIGAGYVTKDGSLRFNAAASGSGNSWGVSGGVSYTFN